MRDANTRLEARYCADLRAAFSSQAPTASRSTVTSADTQVKVEVNYVFRGTLTLTVMRTVVPRAQDMFRVDFEVPTLAGLP